MGNRAHKSAPGLGPQTIGGWKWPPYSAVNGIMTTEGEPSVSRGGRGGV